MKIAVIGANGFIGSRIVESFHLGDGPSVIPISRHPSRVTLAARFALDLRLADAGDEDALTIALAGCAGAVHVVRSSPDDRKRLATVFCRAAARAGVRRLVYLSSAVVHGPNPPADTTEKTRRTVQDLSADALAYAAAERQFFAECRRASLTGFVLRPGVVFGPRSPLFADIANELRGERAWLLNRGEGVCNTLYVDNLVSAIRLCLKSKIGGGESYLIGDAETVTWRDLFHTIARELDLPTRRIRTLSEPPSAEDAERAALQLSASKLSFVSATRHFGYTPVVSFAEGVRRSCAWFRFTEGQLAPAA